MQERSSNQVAACCAQNAGLLIKTMNISLEMSSQSHATHTEEILA
jgi:hypothetical protein